MRFIPTLGQAVPFIVVAFVVAGLGSLLLTPLVRSLVRRFGILDHPNHRRVNIRPVPRGGGLAVASAFLAVALGVVVANDRLVHLPVPLSIDPPALVALLGGGLVAALIGLLDDYYQLRARYQLAGQLALALVAVFLGVTVDFVNSPFGTVFLRDGLAAAVTVLWVVGMINSINFIDGLDGLSSGIGLIAATTLGLISLTTTVAQPFVAVLCFALAGSLLGFLRWNFHPAAIFTGTSGVMFLGYTLAILSILGVAKVAVAVLVLGVPIIDTFWIIVRRVASGRSPFTPDRGHIHHRLLDLGMTQTQTVLLIYAICLGLAVMSLLLSGTGPIYAFLGVLVVGGVVLFVLTQRSISVDAFEAEAYTEHNGHVATVSARVEEPPASADAATAKGSET